MSSGCRSFRCINCIPTVEDYLEIKDIMNSINERFVDSYVARSCGYYTPFFLVIANEISFHPREQWEVLGAGELSWGDSESHAKTRSD